MDIVPQGRSALNENMYLVVRSLKHNNEKIVSGNIITQENNQIIQIRTTKYKNATSWKSEELSSP